jgi:uncharacterized protein (TIGR03437 family)
MKGAQSVIHICVLAAGVSAQAPVVVQNGVVNGASFTAGQPVAPGSLVSVFGDNLASSLASASSVPFSTELAGVTVQFNGIPAPVRDTIPGTATSRAQINTQIPWEALGGQSQGAVSVVVTRGGVASAPQQVQLGMTGPGVFTTPLGVGFAIVVNPDGTVAAPVGAIPGLLTRPGRRGEAVFFYANGLGPVDPPGVNGADSLDRLRATVNPVSVIIDGISVTPQFAGLAPQFPGVNQINFVIPQGTRSGLVPIQVEVGGVRSPNQANIAIE